MYKKIIIIQIIFILILFHAVSFAYTDTEGHWAEKDINSLAINGIISGYKDNSFKPNNNMTRAELVTIINRILGNYEQSTKYVPDIRTKDWFYEEIRKGMESGIIVGDVEGKVRPNDFITREEAIVMLGRAFVPDDESSFVVDYNDLDEVSPWAKQVISNFAYKKYISGYKDKTIRPKNYITRAEVVKIINNVIDIYGKYGTFTGDLRGDLLVHGNSIKLNNLTLDGNLIICEGATNLEIENIIVNGDLIARVDMTFPEKGFKVNGKIYNIKPEKQIDESKYENPEYGISFSIPKGAKVVYISDEKNQRINYKQKNLMTIRINKDDELYFKSFSSGLFKERYRFEVPYEEIKLGTIGRYRYAIYGYEKQESYFLYLKRDNVEYSIYFYNLGDANVIDALVDSILLFEGSKIDVHTVKTYQNEKLHLKFNYVDYVTVDDSYNTNVVNEDEGFYKLFIQVTNIVDMSNYSIEQLKGILVGLEDTESTIVDTKIKKVYVYDAIEYTVSNDGKYSKSLYVIIANKLYHFIFTSDEEKMVSAGTEIYEDIVNNIQF